MKLLEINPRFIEDHIEELIKIEDYVPISFKSYGAQDKREEFLNSKNLLQTIIEMDELVRQKCNHAEDSVKAYNSVLIEWLDFHPEFEDMIAAGSQMEYQYLKQNNEYIGFIEFLFSVKLLSEKIRKIRNTHSENIGFRDDSTIQLPDFDKIEKIYLKYPNTLLADYLSYLV